MRKRNAFLIFCLLWAHLPAGPVCEDALDSGGPLLPEQASYDVTRYDLSLRVLPDQKSIEGALIVDAVITSPLSWFVLDLDCALRVDSVFDQRESVELAFQRRAGRLWIAWPATRQPGERVSLKIRYGGAPRVAPRPPWDGGFTWAQTSQGLPWIATSCQKNGADLWWPNKDHVSDKPDAIDLHITVDDPLVVASNGTLLGTESNADKTRTFHWSITNPVSNYNIALNIAPYRSIEQKFRSVAGDIFPVTFWVLPENYAKGQALFPEILDHLRFFEELLGPYPFRSEKYGVAETPHLGMEHQTIIAYGANFENGAMTRGVDWGFDALHHHELAHEWWGNLVTNTDWSDMWLHEGFATYMQALYVERLQGKAGYHRFMDSLRQGIRNQVAVAPRRSRSAKEVPGDVYNKGAWILHSLRYLLGEDTLRLAMRRMAYPDSSREKLRDGTQVRFVASDDFLHLLENLSGQDLDWLFEVYLRRASLPRLLQRREAGRLHLQWEVEGNAVFPMPVEVAVGQEVRRLEMPGGRGTLDLPADAIAETDPRKWILRDVSEPPPPVG